MRFIPLLCLLSLTASCRTTAKLNNSTAESSNVELTVPELEVMQAKATAASKQSDNLGNMRYDLQDAMEGRSALEKQKQIASFSLAIDGVAATLQDLLVDLSIRLATPEIRDRICKIAEINPGEVAALVQTIKDLTTGGANANSTSPLSLLRIDISKYAVVAQGRPDPSNPGGQSVADLRNDMRAQIEKVSDGTKQITRTLDTWFARVRDRQPGPPPRPTGPSLTQRDFYCQQMNPSYAVLENRLMMRTTYSDGTFKATTVRDFKTQAKCNAFMNLVKPQCGVSQNCNIFLCNPTNDSYDVLNNDLRQFVMMTNTETFYDQLVQSFTKQANCEVVKTKVAGKCSGMNACAAYACVSTNQNYDVLNNDLYLYKAEGNTALVKASVQGSYNTQAECKQALGSN